jgi:hypothetical protein
MAGQVSAENGKKGGRPKGSLNKTTLEKKKVEEAFTQRVLNAADRLFNAQLALAEGTTHVFKIVETGEGKQKKREHVLVTDPEEIKAFLDEYDGGSGEMNGEYYYLTTKAPDNRAIDSLLDRAFGKAINKTEISGKNGEAIQVNVTNYGDKPSVPIPAQGIPDTSTKSD